MKNKKHSRILETIYSILADIDTKSIQQVILNGKSHYRTKWGLYGTAEWLDALKRDNLVETIEGSISRVYMGGHNDFAMFEVTDGKDNYEFARHGNDLFYQVGNKVILECVRLKNIRPMSGLEELLVPIIIRI